MTKLVPLRYNKCSNNKNHGKRNTHYNVNATGPRQQPSSLRSIEERQQPHSFFTMLSGIRTGKAKKKKAKTRHLPRDGDTTNGATSSATTTNADTKEDNMSVAERLKKALASGAPLETTAVKRSYMERTIGDRGVVAADGDSSTTTIVLDGPESRYSKKREEDMTVSELAAKERTTTGGMSWNEQMTRNILRVSKKRKMKLKTANVGVDSDEEVETLKRHLPDYHLNKSSNDGGKNAETSTKQLEQEEQRDKRRQIDRYQKQEKITSMCSWWINSSSFAKDRLLAFGKHVSLMMAPLNASLVKGHHFYLVPLKHAPSMVDCDDHDVREEMKRFRTGLENMYARQGKGIILVETVLPNRNFWQTKVEVIPVSFSQLQDAPIYFKSSMVEQAEEFGTHTNLIQTSGQKPLASLVPKKFPYFHIDWGNISASTTTGYAQIIESSSFPKDFGLDTLAGMMGVDPVRFHRKETFPKGTEKKLVTDFEEKWKAFDWTQQLED